MIEEIIQYNHRRYFVGCDVGTSSTKSCVMDEMGNVLGSKSIEYKLYTPHPSWAEHNPEDYWNAAADTMKLAIQKANIDPALIRGVSISALSPSCILVDKDLNPLQYGHIWMDRRGSSRVCGSRSISEISGYSRYPPIRLIPIMGRSS